MKYLKPAFKTAGVGIVQYWYAWAVDRQTNKPVRQFNYCKCHRNDSVFKWIFPIHERLDINSEVISKYKVTQIPDITLVYHYPDLTKTRNSYLPLLLIRAQENPEDSNTMYYIAREYGFKQDWLSALSWYLKLWLNYYTNEKVKQMDVNAIKHVYWNMAEIYKNINALDDARHYYEKGLKECPCQMLYISAALFYDMIKEPDKAL